jgi:hypothetical protein
MAEEFATHLIKCLWLFGKGKRNMIVGAEDQQYIQDYDPQSLKAIDRIIVEAVDPVANSIAGRVAEATDLLQAQMIKNVQEYVMVKETGNLDVMVHAERAELMKIREENELLLQGKQVEVLFIDNHPLHIPEHRANLSTQRNVNNQLARQATLTHMMLHAKSMLVDSQDPMQGLLMATLGIPIPQQPVGPPGGPPGGTPGGPPGQPGQEPPPKPPAGQEQPPIAGNEPGATNG